jgi:hypothetical protein
MLFWIAFDRVAFFWAVIESSIHFIMEIKSMDCQSDGSMKGNYCIFFDQIISRSHKDTEMNESRIGTLIPRFLQCLPALMRKKNEPNEESDEMAWRSIDE